MSLGTGVLDWLAEQAGKEGLEASESAALKGIAEQGEKSAFNSPNFKINKQDVNPEEFGQVAGYKAPEAIDKELAPLQKTPNMTPLKEDVPAFSNIPGMSPNTGIESSSEGGAAATPALLGTTGAAGLAGTAALMGNGQSQAQSNDSGESYNALQNLPGFLQENSVSQPPVPLRGDDNEQQFQSTDLGNDGQSENEQEEEDDGEEGTKNTIPANSGKSGGGAKLSARPSIQEIANLISTQGEASKANLQNALKNRDLSQLVNSLGKSAETIGDAFSRQAPKSNGAFDQNIAQANQYVTDYQAKVANEAKDPGSAVSQNYRKFLERYGVKVPDNVSAEQVQQVLLPAAEKEQLAKENAANRLQMKQLGMAQIAANKAQTSELAKSRLQQALDFRDRTEGDQVLKEMNGLTASSRSALGAAATSKVKAQRLADLLNRTDATPQDYNSASMDMNSIISGAATVSGSKDQQYNNLKTIMAKGLQFLGSEPHSVDAPKVKAHLISVAQQMQQISDDVQNKQLGRVKAGHADFFKRRPEVINGIMNSIQGDEGTSQQSLPHQGQYPPGSTVRVDKKLYKVAPDGDTLIGAD